MKMFVMWGVFCDFMGEGNSKLAELLAAVLAIEKAKNLGWRKLCLETDCMIVVKAFSYSALVPWKISSRWLYCHAYTCYIDFMISLHREANFCADFLVKFGLSIRCYSWFYFIHSILVKDYLLDKKGTPRLKLFF